MANISLDVQCLVACIDCNDDAKDKGLHNRKDKVRFGERLDNFCREVAPGNLHVGGVSGNENDSLRKEESRSDSACTKDDIHDDHCDSTTNYARHDKVTDGVDAHGRKSVYFGIDNHAADVSGQRGACTACDEERCEDGTQFADDDHHDEGADVI